MNNKIVIVFGIILFLIILGLWSYYVYTQYIGSKSTKSAPVQLTPLSEEEQLLLDYSNIASPSAETTAKYLQDAEKYAQDSEVVTISECRAYPLVLKTSPGKQFQMKNNNSADYHISLGPSYSLLAKQTITVKVDFEPGVYGYRCFSKKYQDQPMAGIILVKE